MIVAGVVPRATGAQLRLSVEQGYSKEDGEAAVAAPLSSFCDRDVGCSIRGFVGDTFVRLYTPTTPWSGLPGTAETLADALKSSVTAAGEALPLPPLSSEWASGPRSCEEMIPAVDFAKALEVPEIHYGYGFPLDSSDGYEYGLLAAGGFACSYSSGVDREFSGRVTVLPDAGEVASDLIAAAAEPRELAGSAAGPLVVECWNNGDPPWTESSTGECTLIFSKRGALVRVSASDHGISRDALRDRAEIVARVVSAALS